MCVTSTVIKVWIFAQTQLLMSYYISIRLMFLSLLFLFQLWRPVTATLYFPITPNTGFLYLVNLYFLYHYSTRLETGETTALSHTHTHTLDAVFVIAMFSLHCFPGAFDGRPADYIFMLLFNWICIVVSFDRHYKKPFKTPCLKVHYATITIYTW